MEERGLLNDAETMLCVAVVVKQYLQHAVSTGAREHALLAEITHSLPRRSPELPPLHEICGFCGTVVELTAIDAPCAIIALIHLERAMQAQALALLPASWRVLLVTVSLVALGLVSILALNAVRVINAVSFDYLLL